MSAVWQFFSKLADDKAQCNFLINFNGVEKICGKILGRKSTTALWNHLKLHDVKRVQVEEIVQDSEEDCNSSCSSSSSIRSFAALSTKSSPKFLEPSKYNTIDHSEDATVARLAALDALSFSRIAQSYDIARMAKPHYPTFPLSPNGVRNRVMKYKDKIQQCYVDEIQDRINRGAKFGLIHDEWTSVSNRRYLNVQVTDSEKKWDLGLMRVKGRCGSEELRDHISQFLMKFGIKTDKHILAATMDGCSVNKKLGRIANLRVQLCMVHGIHLAVLDVLYNYKEESEEVEETDDNDDECEDDLSGDVDRSFELLQEGQEESDENVHSSIDAVVKKVRKVAKFFKRSPKRNDALQDERVEAGMRSKSLKLDVKTRWNSLLVMLQTFHDDHEMIRKQLIEHKSDISFSECEIDQVKKIVDTLLPVKAAVEQMCVEKSNLLIADRVIEFMFLQIAKVDLPLARVLQEKLKSRIRERRTILSDVMQTLFDNYQSSNMRNILGINPTKRDIVKTINDLAEEVCNIKNLDKPEDEDNELPNNPVAENAELSMQEKLLVFMNSFEQYESANCVDEVNINQVKQELKFLNERGTRGPTLARIFDSMKSIRPTSVDSERSFSTAGRYATKFRAALGDASLNGLVFLKSYFVRLFKAKNKKQKSKS